MIVESATPLLTREAIAELQRRGLARLAVSLDSSAAEVHDAFPRVPCAYQPKAPAEMSKSAQKC